MSASYLVDLSTVTILPSIVPAAGVGGTPASGVIVGLPVDLLYANTYTQLLVTGGVSTSGSFKVMVQTADVLTSGSFTDPTSGMPAGAYPTGFLSGGILVCNSGGATSGSPNNSGIVTAGAFQRPHRYARAIIMSGDQTNSPITVLVLGQTKTTGSGGGFSYSPGSGTPAA